jgi:hypothetical protein
MSRSRTRWLAGRAAFLVVVLVVLLMVVAIVGEVLASAQMPSQHLDRDFAWYGRRGALVLVRGLASMGIGVLVGAWLGRVLPALLIAVFASVLIFSGISLGMDRWLEGNAVVLPFGVDRAGGRSLGQRIELPSGELVSYSDFHRDQTWDVEGDIFGAEGDIGHPDRIIGRDRELVVPGSLYQQIVLRESAGVGSTAILLALGAVLVVSRRRPR